jgi:hypothetical protein
MKIKIPFISFSNDSNRGHLEKWGPARICANLSNGERQEVAKGKVRVTLDRRRPHEINARWRAA